MFHKAAWLAGAIVLVGLAAALRPEATAAKPIAAALLASPRSQIIGNPHGDVTIVEFFDYACPFCKAVEPRLEGLVKSDDNVKLLPKEFPILSPQSIIASKVAIAAAAQGKYTQFHQAMLSYRGPLDEAAIFGVAKDVGLNLAQLRRDMAKPEVTKEISANLTLAQAIHVQGTPTLFVNGVLLTQPSAEIDFPAVVAAARQKNGR